MRENVDFILKRHCCRSFLNKELKSGDLEILMESAQQAPSAGNCQGWFFYVVEKKDIKIKLGEAAYGQMYLADASVVFVICVDPEVSASRYGDRGRTLYCLQDAAAAAENLLLAATCLGYGSCWVGAFDENAVRGVLNIPDKLRPVALIPIGPGKLTSSPSRKTKEEIFKII